MEILHFEIIIHQYALHFKLIRVAKIYELVFFSNPKGMKDKPPL